MQKESVVIDYNSDISTLNFNILIWILFDSVRFKEIMSFAKPNTWEEFGKGIKFAEIRLNQVEKLQSLTNNGIYTVCYIYYIYNYKYTVKYLSR